MFENNLVKDEIQRQRKYKTLEEENKLINDDSSDYNNGNYYKKKRKKFKKSRSDINLNNRYERHKRNEFDPVEFQQKTAMNARAVLNNIKNNLGTYLVEDELKKNEQFQILSEDINELKTDLNSKLDKIQKSQNQQLQNIYLCLLNSGDKSIENAAFRLLNDYSDENNIKRKFSKKESLKKSSLGESFRKSNSRVTTNSFFNKEV